MNRLTFWTAWLMVVSLTMAVFGILMALLNQTRLFGGLMGEIENVFWPNGGATLGLLQFQEWVLGVWGATVAGFGLLAALVGGNAFGRRERWARDALAAALALWFLLDTALSLASRVWVNAAFNTVVLALFVLPLAFTWNQFLPGRDGAR